MSADAFLDSGILIAALDVADPQRQQVAKRVISETRYLISTETLSEFFTVTTGRMAQPLSVRDAESAVNALIVAAGAPVISVDAAMVREAIRFISEYHLSYQPALMLAAAIRSGCKRVLTESLLDGAILEGVRVENPFSDIG
jgi:predicted nucleic acid-binding protein